MKDTILGIHHITAIARNARRNFEFYSKVLGLRLVKKTVNFDDPYTYHFYYGDEAGSPGTIMTFFPWEGISSGTRGTGMATEIGYSVPEDSLGFWTERFERYNVTYSKPTGKFGEPCLVFTDPDGLRLELIASKAVDTRKPWTTPEVKADVATRGFHHVTLTLASVEATADVLTDVFEYKPLGQEGNRYRFATDAVENAAIVDLVESPGIRPGQVAGGSVHHVAFRVLDLAVQQKFRDRIASRGLDITERIDRNYFYSVYFREPGGVLFEIATDNPGFTIDEPLGELGTHLRLPSQYERRRSDIEQKLPQIH
jgi:glyoxalase family protein